MKTRLQALTLVLLAFDGLFALQSASANQLYFSLVNNTGRDIKGVYVCAVDAGTWGPNLMNTILHNGQKFPLSFNSRENAPIYWNIRVRYLDGDTAEWFQGFNLYRIAAITLYYDEDGNPMAQYEVQE